MDGYTSTSGSIRNTLTSRRSQSSSGVSLPPIDYSSDRYLSTDISENISSSQQSQLQQPKVFTIEDRPSSQYSNSFNEQKNELDLEEIPVPFGPLVIRRVPLVLPSARVTLIRRCFSAFRNVGFFIFYLIYFLSFNFYPYFVII